MYVWYDTMTRDVIHLSEPPFTVAPPTGQAVVQITDAPLPGPYTQLRLTADLTALEIDPALVPPAAPDWAGFLRWISVTFTPARITAVGNAYSPFFGFCQFGNAAGAQWCIADAKTNAAIVGGALTATEYSQFQTANTTYHLGMTLP